MKVEDLQSIWTEMSGELEKQKKLTHEIIMQMTQERYKNQLQKIANYEGFGAIVCFLAALFILININKLETWYELLSGFFTIAFLIVIPVLVLGSIRSMKQINIQEGNYADTLRSFTTARNHFLFMQKIGIGLGFVLILTILPVASKILKGKNLFEETGAWTWYIPVMFVFLILFSRWGYRHYNRITRSAGNILSEMEDQQ